MFPYYSLSSLWRYITDIGVRSCSASQIDYLLVSSCCMHLVPFDVSESLILVDWPSCLQTEDPQRLQQPMRMKDKNIFIRRLEICCNKFRSGWPNWAWLGTVSWLAGCMLTGIYLKVLVISSPQFSSTRHSIWNESTRMASRKCKNFSYFSNVVILLDILCWYIPWESCSLSILSRTYV